MIMLPLGFRTRFASFNASLSFFMCSRTSSKRIRSNVLFLYGNLYAVPVIIFFKFLDLANLTAVGDESIPKIFACGYIILINFNV